MKELIYFARKLQREHKRGVALLCFLPCVALAEPVGLRCEYRDSPLGIDCPTPRLSWQSDSKERDWSQTAYQVFVATSPKRIREGNHYAFGSVVAWLYQNVAGIGVAAEGPGFRRIVIRPRPDARLAHAHGEYDSVYGKIVTNWSMETPRRFVLNVVIPANTHAVVCLPEIPRACVTESGREIHVQKQQEWNVFEVGAGTYHFDVH